MKNFFLTQKKIESILKEIINQPSFHSQFEIFKAVEDQMANITRESLEKFSEWPVEHFLLLNAGFLFEEIMKSQYKVWCFDTSVEEFELCIMSDEIKGIKPNKIYIKRDGDFLQYTLIKLGKVITDKIPAKDWTLLIPGIRVTIPDYAFDKKTLDLIEPRILDIIEKNGHIRIKNFWEREIFLGGYIYIMKKMPERELLFSKYKGNMIFLNDPKKINVFYIDNTGYPLPLPFSCKFHNFLKLKEFKNHNVTEPLAGEICKKLRGVFSLAIIEQTIKDVLNYYTKSLGFIINKKSEKPKDFLKLRQGYLPDDKVKYAINPLFPNEIIYRHEFSYLKIHPILEQLILLKAAGLDEEKARNGIPRPETCNIKRASELLTDLLKKTISPTNVLELCCKNLFGAYLLSRHPQIKEQFNVNNVYQNMEIKIKYNFTEKNYEYPYDGLVRILKNPLLGSENNLKKFRDGGIIESDYRIELQCSVSELILGKDIALVPRSDRDKIRISIDDLLFVEEELIVFSKGIPEENFSPKESNKEFEDFLRKTYHQNSFPGKNKKQYNPSFWKYLKDNFSGKKGCPIKEMTTWGHKDASITIHEINSGRTLYPITKKTFQTKMSKIKKQLQV